MAVIAVEKLKKHFGAVKAVDGVSFTVEKGEIFGFLGPNGAGKTTTIRCMMDFIRPTSGTLQIFGQDAHQNAASLKTKIGFLSGQVRLYDGWTGQEHINFIQATRGKSKLAQELIEKLDFNPRIKFKNLSSGNKQKLGLILALMSDPELLIMDEPTVGLDPLLQNTIYTILEDFKKRGATIFMSSHNLPEVERLCRRVAIIKAGKIIAMEDISKLHAKRMHTVTAYFADSFDKNDFLSKNVTLEQELPDGLILNSRGDINPLLHKLSQHKIKDLEVAHASLEEVFLEFYQSGRK